MRRFLTGILMLVATAALIYGLCASGSEALPATQDTVVSTRGGPASGGQSGQAGLDQNCSLTATPNPFSASTQITYTTPVKGAVILAVYDVAGRCVATLVNNVVKQPSVYSINYRPKISAGVYFVRLKVGDVGADMKIVRIKSN